MKKVIFLLMFAGVSFTACDKDQPGGTATEALAGEWYVAVDGVDASGNLVVKDPHIKGRTMLYTYNTAANIPTEMYVMDEQSISTSFWYYKARVKSDINTLTFATEGTVKNESIKQNKPYDIDITIEGGKIIPNGTVSPHGTIVDSIVFYVNFEDDALADTYAKLRVSGFRYTGLAEDEF